MGIHEIYGNSFIFVAKIERNYYIIQCPTPSIYNMSGIYYVFVVAATVFFIYFWVDFWFAIIKLLKQKIIYQIEIDSTVWLL